jgi:ribosomal protein L17
VCSHALSCRWKLKAAELGKDAKAVSARTNAAVASIIDEISNSYKDQQQGYTAMADGIATGAKKLGTWDD